MTDQLEQHDWVYSVESVGVSGMDWYVIQTTQNVLPHWFLANETWRVEQVWLDTVPSRIMGTLLGDERARRMGFGRAALSIMVRRSDS